MRWLPSTLHREGRRVVVARQQGLVRVMIEERVVEGGLFRCCLASLHEHLILAQEPSVEGETLDCRYEPEGNRNLVFQDGAWRWNKDG